MESKQHLEDQVASLQKQVKELTTAISSIQRRQKTLADLIRDGLLANTQAGGPRSLEAVLDALRDF